MVQLGKIASIKMGQSPPSLTYNDTGDGVPFLQGKAEFGELYPTPVKWCSSPVKVANPGAVLVSVRAPAGDVNVATAQYCIGRGLAAIEGTDAYNDFLFYWLRFSKGLLEARGTGTTFKSINKDTLASFPVPLPPLPEQRAIAQVLRTVQRAKEATERVLAATRELKKSLMRHLFTYGPVPIDQVDQVRLKETEIGPVPEHWEVVKLGEVVDVKGGKRLPKGHSFSDTPTQHPYIRVVDFADGSITSSNLKFLTSDDFAVLQRYTISSEDVYISIAGTIGLVGTVPEELDGANLTENAAKLVIRNKTKILRDFLKTALSCNEQQRQISALATKTSQPKLALARVKQLYILLPPLPEQRAIAEMLRAVDRKIQAEEQRKAALDALFRTLLHHLMTGKVRVRGAVTESEE